jgi:hypothetical protein
MKTAKHVDNCRMFRWSDDDNDVEIIVSDDTVNSNCKSLWNGHGGDFLLYGGFSFEAIQVVYGCLVYAE